MGNETLDTLRLLLSDYEEEGSLVDYNEKILINLLESNLLESIISGLYFYGKEDLNRKERKNFIRMLKEFGGMDDRSDVPTGRALEFGYGSVVFFLIGRLTPWWKRWIIDSIGFCTSCLIVGFLTKWLLHSFSAGVFTVIILRSIGHHIKFIHAIYFQNEFLIRKQVKKKLKKATEES